LPATAGTNSYVLTTNGSGVLSWSNPSGLEVSLTGDITGSAGSNTIDPSNSGIGGRLATALNTASNNSVNADVLKYSSPLSVDGSNQLTVANNAIALGKIAQIADQTLLGNNSGGAGDVTALSTATVKTILNLSNTNSGDVTLTGEDYLSLSGQQITANPVDLATSNITGILPDGNIASSIARDNESPAAGDVSGSLSAGYSVDKIKGNAVPADAAGVLTNDGAGTLTWEPASTGTVTSVAVSGNDGIVVNSGSPITTSGTIDLGISNNGIALGKIAQIADQTLLGNNSGGAGDVTALSTATVKTMLNLSNTNSGDVTVTGENYLSLSGQQITANPIDLTGSNVTGELKAASFPILTGDVTTTGGSLSTTIANDAVTTNKIANENVTLAKISSSGAGTGQVITYNGSSIVWADNAATVTVTPITPATLSTTASDNDNWNPTGISNAGLVELNADNGDATISGIVAQETGRMLVLINVGAANYITLLNQSASSSAVNRFAIAGGDDLMIGPGGSATLIYSGSRWRVISTF
jgi:hypothetical protein